MADDIDIDLPEPIIRGTTWSRSIEEILRPREPNYEHMFKPGQEHLGHYYLPPFQRPAVWTRSQSARLVESVHLGISIGSVVVSDSDRTIRVREGDKVVDRFPDHADWLIDGQQRLRALKAYIEGELTVFAGTPHEHRFGDLSKRQKRRFLGTPMGFIKLDATSAEQLARIYDLLCFGGTAHTEDQRASAQATE